MEGIKVEHLPSNKETAKSLHRIADAIEAGKFFRIQINGHRVTAPAAFEIELATGEGGDLEIKMRWDNGLTR